MSFFNNPLTRHVSGTTMPIFRGARPYIAAYGFQHSMLPAGVLEEPGSGQCAQVCWRLASRSK